MRRCTALPFVLILGLVAALGTTPGLLGAQEGDGEGPPGVGIDPQRPGEEGKGITVEDLGPVGDGLNAYT